MTKLPTRSPTDEDLPIGRLSSMGLELEDIADGDIIALPALIELAEDRGRPASHYLVAIPLATELRVGPAAPTTVRICAGNCQRWGARDLIDHLVDRIAAAPAGTLAIAPVTCLDRCDLAPACEIHGDHGTLVIAPVTRAALDQALDELAR
ncbi:MAG TPA: (2Fe-2S) ferredoxin domain-containing protein [Kofleriaceae bacterium]|jgi:NADH:ubiquinone oxidoreductase subunit E|nr:(2Fe-2S) ferredoxin domain-containing protein [Kofleriaceae bacterium]